MNSQLVQSPALYYQRHVFICVNKRQEKSACADFDSQAARDYLKKAMKGKGMYGEGSMRVSNSGCLGRCELGPVLVVYPEGTWYTYVDHADIDEILEEHLAYGRVVERLLLEI